MRVSEFGDGKGFRRFSQGLIYSTQQNSSLSHVLVPRFKLIGYKRRDGGWGYRGIDFGKYVSVYVCAYLCAHVSMC